MDQTLVSLKLAELQAENGRQNLLASKWGRWLHKYWFVEKLRRSTYIEYVDVDK